jgi:hypothetical protein
VTIIREDVYSNLAAAADASSKLVIVEDALNSFDARIQALAFAHVSRQAKNADWTYA